MIDPRIIQALKSSDPDKRKKAVTYLAKSLNKDALPHLANVYKSDEDPEVRELAKKARAYIQKNVSQNTTQYHDNVKNVQDVRSKRSYADDDRSSSDEEADISVPSTIEVSSVAQERAKVFVEQAMDWNVRGNPNKAIEMLRKAFSTNPNLLYDSYTIGLVTSITGRSADDVRRMFAPNARERKVSRNASDATIAPTNRLTAVQQFFVLILFIGSIATLVGFFALPWVDFGWMPIPQSAVESSLDGLGSFGGLQSTGIDVSNLGTMGNALSEFQNLLNQPEVRDLEAQANLFGEQGDLIRRLINGFRSIRLNASGMDTMLYMIGSQDALSAFLGLGSLIDLVFDAFDDPMVTNLILSSLTRQFGGVSGLGIDTSSFNPDTIRMLLGFILAQLKYTPQALDFSVIALPVTGSLALLFTLLLYLTPRMMWWFLNIVVGLLGVGACAYFYTTGINELTVIGGTNIITTLNEIGITVASSAQFIGWGFWVSIGGIIAVTITPFLGLLFAPAKPTA